MPTHHNAEAYPDAYLEASEISDDKKGPLFRSLDRCLRLTARRLVISRATTQCAGDSAHVQ